MFHPSGGTKKTVSFIRPRPFSKYVSPLDPGADLRAVKIKTKISGGLLDTHCSRLSHDHLAEFIVYISPETLCQYKYSIIQHNTRHR